MAMSIVGFIGLALWVLVVITGTVDLFGWPVKDSWRMAIWLILFPLIGVLFTALGLLGLVMIAPILDLLGLKWFIVTNF